MSARDRKELKARERGFLPAQMSWTDSLRIGASLQKPIAQRHWGGGVDGREGAPYMVCKGTPRMPGLP